MRDLKEIFLEKLGLNNTDKIRITNLNTSRFKGNNPEISEDEAYEIEAFCQSKLPLQPTEVRYNSNGGVVIYFAELLKRYSSSSHLQITISKSEKYMGGYKITWFCGNYMAYELPISKNPYKSDGKTPRLETLDEVFQIIKQKWQKSDFSRVLKELSDYKNRIKK